MTSTTGTQAADTSTTKRAELIALTEPRPYYPNHLYTVVCTDHLLGGTFTLYKVHHKTILKLMKAAGGAQ